MKTAFALSIVAALALTSAMPAFAAGPEGKSSSSEFLKESAMFPVKIMAVGTAFAVGTPISVVRSEVNRLGQYTEAFVDEGTTKDGSLGLMLASVPGEVLHTVSTVGEGIWRGGEHALSGWDKPFSAASFSLEDQDK